MHKLYSYSGIGPIGCTVSYNGGVGLSIIPIRISGMAVRFLSLSEFGNFQTFVDT